MKRLPLLALLASIALLTSCNPVCAPCVMPARLHMPETLKVKLKAMDKTDEESQYLRDLRDQQLLLQLNGDNHAN